MRYMPWSPAYFERIRPVFLESWPDPLVSLSIPQRRIEFSQKDAAQLNSSPPLWRDRLLPSDPPEFQALASRLQTAIDSYPSGGFVRLGSRSPKDSSIFHRNRGCSRHAITAIKLLQTSNRIHNDLDQCLAREYVPALFLREWMPVQPWQEFRCFMQRRKLVGISQLDVVNHGAHPEIESSATLIEQSIRAFFPAFQAACHLDSVVFDVIVTPVSGSGLSTRLLELNPWGGTTSPAMFSWHDLDGTFRYARAGRSL